MGADGPACRGGTTPGSCNHCGDQPRADATAHHRRGHGMVALIISQQAMAELTCAADTGSGCWHPSAQPRHDPSQDCRHTARSTPTQCPIGCLCRSRQRKRFGSMTMIWCLIQNGWKLHRMHQYAPISSYGDNKFTLASSC